MKQLFHEIKINTKGQGLYDFTEKTVSWIEKQKIDIWVGPINSLYGSHLLKITDSISSKAPELEEVSELVIKDLKFQMKSNEMEDFLKILRTKYTVQVQSES